MHTQFIYNAFIAMRYAVAFTILTYTGYTIKSFFRRLYLVNSNYNICLQLALCHAKVKIFVKAMKLKAVALKLNIGLSIP